MLRPGHNNLPSIPLVTKVARHPFVKVDLIELYNLAVAATRKTNSPSNRRAIVAKVLLLLSVGVWFGCSALYEHYNRTRPNIENRVGRVLVQNNHGHHVYLNAPEYYGPILLGITAVTLFLAGSLVDPERRLWRWRALR